MSSITITDKEANVSSWRIVKMMIPAMLGLMKVMIKHPVMTVKMAGEMRSAKKRVKAKDESRQLSYTVPSFLPEMAHPASEKVYQRPRRYIESTSPEIMAMAHKLGAYQKSEWDYAFTVFEFVKKDIYTSLAAPVRGAVGALKFGEGTCLDKTQLFLALCRAAGIPGRIRMSQEVFTKNLYDNWNMQPIAKEWYDQMGYFLAHAMAEVFINGEWVPADFSVDYRMEAQLKLPIARLGDEPEGTWNWPVPGSVIRCESFPSFLVFFVRMGFKMGHSMMVIWQDVMETTCFREGENNIAACGGVEAYDRLARQTHKAVMPDVSKKLFKALRETEKEADVKELESSATLSRKR
jgi:hypothetical protein